jgi:hypothetical protein
MSSKELVATWSLLESESESPSSACGDVCHTAHSHERSVKSRGFKRTSSWRGCDMARDALRADEECTTGVPGPKALRFALTLPVVDASSSRRMPLRTAR